MDCRQQDIARYMETKFLHTLSGMTGYLPFPQYWSLDELLECDRAVRILAAAFKNQNWDIDRYCDFLSRRQSGRNAKVEADLRKKFQPLFSHGLLLEYPALITDRHGIAMVWYLPGLLTSARHDTLWASVPILQPHLTIKKGSRNWRVGPEFFKLPGLCKNKPGSVSLSPAWFHQGYTTDVWLMDISSPLKAKSGDEALDWCRETKSFSELLGGILNIIQPELFRIGTEAMLKLTADPAHNPWVPAEEVPRLHDILTTWGHPWTAMSVMVNRATPCHRDVNGRNNWMDLLVTLGEYSLGRLELPGLGVRLVYDPRTVVGILGKVISHGVGEVNGDRACLAYYMRDGVHERLGLPPGTWMNVNHYIG